MQGRITSLAKKAGRHFLQLLKDYLWARIGLFVILCVGIVFMCSNSLGQSPQAITAFSAGTEDKDKSDGFQEVHGLKRAQENHQLYNPFEQDTKAGGMEKKSPPQQGSVAGAQSTGKNSQGNKQNKTNKELPVLRGIMWEGQERASLIEYEGEQYLLKEGEAVKEIVVEQISEERVQVRTSHGRRILTIR